MKLTESENTKNIIKKREDESKRKLLEETFTVFLKFAPPGFVSELMSDVFGDDGSIDQDTLGELDFGGDIDVTYTDRDLDDNDK